MTSSRHARGTSRHGEASLRRTPTDPSAAATADLLGSSTATQFSTFAPHLSRSAASTSSTNATSTSKFSLSTSFINLTARDVAFFDHVVDLLPPQADGFAALKRAYNQLRVGGEYIVDGERDIFLWDTLLKLIQVRGKDWASRWDAVRMAIGLEPRMNSESEREEREIDDDDDDDDEEESESDTAQGAAVSRSNNTTRAEIEALRKRMALLTAEAGSLVGTIARKQESETIAPVSASREARVAKGGGRTVPVRQLRFAEQEGGGRRKSEKATVVESASDEEASRLRAIPQRQKNQGQGKRSDGQSNAAQRQFDEVVARSRNEREAQRKLQEEKQEAAEESRLVPLLRKADELSGIHLIRKCFLWWHTLSEQRVEKEGRVRRARDEVIARKALTAWVGKLAGRRGRVKGAEKVDVIRCKLRAWRVWLRSLHETRQARREEKRVTLKGAYALTRKKSERRVIKETFERWKMTLMEHQTALFRTQHLVRGAFYLWRLHLWRSKTLREKEVAVKEGMDDQVLVQSWDRWREATRVQSSIGLAQGFRRDRLLHSVFLRWTHAREERATARRKEALADRWRARRTKRNALRGWQEKLGEVKKMEMEADSVQHRHLGHLCEATLKVWVLREREELFARVKASQIKAQIVTKWTTRLRRLNARLRGAEGLFVDKRDCSTLQRAFWMWRETTGQVVASQHLASERDRRKIKAETFRRWTEAVGQREAEWQRAEAVDAFLLQRDMMAMWLQRHMEAKAVLFQRRRTVKLVGHTVAFWRAQCVQRRDEKLAMGLMTTKIELRIKSQCLQTWTAAVIERKSRLMEAGERRDGFVVQRVWQRWIEACLRHEDMLNLSNSFIDVKKEDFLRRMFAKWVTLARAEQNRRERVEQVLWEKKRIAVEKSFGQWYDRYVEATLRPMEYELLLLRQRTAMQVLFSRWKGRTKSLPAIRLDHARCKSHAFYTWAQRLPLVRLENKAGQRDRMVMFQKGFLHWHAATRTRKALRAAARFGGPSAARLKATAHLRPRGRGNPYGGASSGSSSSPAPLLRVKARSRPAGRVEPKEGAVTATARREDHSSLRESDLVPSMGAEWGPTPVRVVNLPPAMQRWMHNRHQGRQEETFDEMDASSEPPSSILDHRWTNRRVDLVNRTPSPPASRAQSEVTVRVKASPRKLINRTGEDAESTIDLLRSRRKQRRRSMILDGDK